MSGTNNPQIEAFVSRLADENAGRLTEMRYEREVVTNFC
jgi:hypothetical protein